jgi:3-deoxy-7-phosphoheptulonate synthase
MSTSLEDSYLGAVPADRTSLTDDERIERITPLPPPEHLIRFFPIQGTPAERMISDTRRKIREILHGLSDRLLVVIGPCSIHNPDAALEYASRLARERDKHAGELEIVMRVYFEKPRTTVGWKGLINDPHLDGSFCINEGLRIARDLLVRINRHGVPAGSEFLDTISPQYIGDLISWGAIGARTTESQAHRELASGLSCPVGFKNATNGSMRVAMDAIRSSSQPHHFLSVTKEGRSAIFSTKGNEDCHVILRGGTRPNYDSESINIAAEEMEATGQKPRMMVDFSHANSRKQHARQLLVGRDVASQIARGDRRIIGAMIESFIVAGRQDRGSGKELTYGQSITDACISWDDSVPLLDELAAAVRQRRQITKAA